ncbi:MAG TPA: PadR family transcriptional regulator [Acidimicrobiales bacterium]|nr:PadR family transcriptional regulator [Acidimicrobiales bacterium]
MFFRMGWEDDEERGGPRGRGRGRGGRGPFFPGFQGPFPGGRPFGGRRAQRGDVRASVLALLKEKPMHGYQMITELTERSGGWWQPSPGSVYPVLQQLQDEGLVIPEETEGRRVFRLTPAGIEYVEAHAEDLQEPWDPGIGPRGVAVADLWRALGPVAVAAKQVAHTGTPAQLDKAIAILGDARRALYRILADDEPESEGASDAADVPGAPGAGGGE